MKNTLYDGYQGPRITRRAARARLLRVIDQELTQKQRQAIIGYYLDGKNIVVLAQEFGVNKSTVWRTMKRAEERLRRCLRY